jgi:hypothetical protein
MKKTILLIAVMLLFTGCSKDDAVPTNNDAVTGDTSEQGTEESETPDTNAVEGFAFGFNNVVIPMNVDAGPIVEALGEPMEYFEAASCAFQGLDKIYTYSGFELSTYPVGDQDFISTVYFMDDSVATDKGIYIGASLEEVIAAYGDDYTEESGEYIYTQGETTLNFLMEDDFVSAISYYALVEGLHE